MKLSPYPAYKDSGVPWLGEVPEHWDVRRNKLFMREVNERSKDGSEDLLTVSQYTGVTRRRERITAEGALLTNAESLTGYKLVKPNDLVMNIMLAWNGSLGVSAVEGIASPAYCVFRANNEIDPWFLHYLFRTPSFTGSFKTVSTGVVDSRLRLYPEVFFRLPSLLPPKDEQTAIVRFLDHAERRIRRFIRIKRQMIDLLNEQKQGIIHQAVTRGLDSDVRLKPSEVEWLGDVPEHWEVKRNSWIFDERNERGKPGFPVLIVSLRTGVTVGSDQDEEGRPRRLIEDVTAYKLAESGDIAYNMMRMWQGAVGTVQTAGLVSPAYVVARPRISVSSEFFEFLFRTNDCKNEINRNSRGIVSDRNRLYWDQFKRLYLPLPPYDEQIEIVKHIKDATADINVAIDRTHREIDLIREYRTRLITDVVTGKLDVRGVAVGAVEEELEDLLDADIEEMDEDGEAEE
jgi:type I restriction enzyme, S subunit